MFRHCNGMMKPPLHDKPFNALLDSGNALNEHREIERRLAQRGFWLRLPDPLESRYCRAHDSSAAASLPTTLRWALGLHLVLGLMTLMLVHYSALGIWRLSYAVFLVLILVGWFFSRSRIVHTHYQYTICALASAATFFAVFLPV